MNLRADLDLRRLAEAARRTPDSDGTGRARALTLRQLHSALSPDRVLVLLDRLAALEGALGEAHWALVMWLNRDDEAYLSLLDRILPLVTSEAAIRADSLLSGAAPAAPTAPALDTERRAVVAAAAIFLAAHYRVIAANPVTRDDTFAMKNAADTLRDALREYARLANPLKP